MNPEIHGMNPEIRDMNPEIQRVNPEIHYPKSVHQTIRWLIPKFFCDRYWMVRFAKS